MTERKPDRGGEDPAAAEVAKKVRALAPYLGALALAPGDLAPYGSQEAKSAIEDTLRQLFPEDRWQQKGFDILSEFTQRTGPFIEIGGPSPSGYALVDLPNVHQATGKKIIVTNISEEQLDVKVSKETRAAIEIAGYADVRELHYAAGAIGAFFTSSLGFYESPYLFKQAPAMLEKGGLLVAGQLSGLEVALALDHGLELKSYSSYTQQWTSGYESRMWQTIFQKP